LAPQQGWTGRKNEKVPAPATNRDNFYRLLNKLDDCYLQESMKERKLTSVQAYEVLFLLEDI
jgi:hypothetical protein